jgi:hypothetical protein
MHCTSNKYKLVYTTCTMFSRVLIYKLVYNYRHVHTPMGLPYLCCLHFELWCSVATTQQGAQKNNTKMIDWLNCNLTIHS